MASPATYKKATAGLDEAARVRLWGRPFCSDMPLPSGHDDDELADLVQAFYDGNGDGTDADAEKAVARRPAGWKEMLDATMADVVTGWIRVEAERAVRDAGPAAGGDDDGLKKRVVDRLRQRGLDAGLCKSSWDKNKTIAAGTHEHIDVIAGGTSRYIVEINVAFEFEIARPSTEYQELLRSLPAVLVARPEVFKAMARVMCTAAAESIRGAGMHVPPWRRTEYVQVKWSSPYERMTGGARMERPEAGVARSGVTPVGRKFCRMEIGCAEMIMGRESLVRPVFRGL